MGRLLGARFTDEVNMYNIPLNDFSDLANATRVCELLMFNFITLMILPLYEIGVALSYTFEDEVTIQHCKDYESERTPKKITIDEEKEELQVDKKASKELQDESNLVSEINSQIIKDDEINIKNNNDEDNDNS